MIRKPKRKLDEIREVGRNQMRGDQNRPEEGQKRSRKNQYESAKIKKRSDEIRKILKASEEIRRNEQEARTIQKMIRRPEEARGDQKRIRESQNETKCVQNRPERE